MPKVPGVTSEILKKKVLEALEGIGIKASDIMGKGTNVRRLTKGSDINPFKANMLEAMRGENKTLGDALDAFANEAKYIMNANDSETLNFLNNLNTYKSIGGAGVDTQGVGSMFKAMTDLETAAKDLKTSTDAAKTEAEKQMKDALVAAQHGGPFKVPDEKFLGGTMHEEGQLRTGIRQFLQTELDNGRLKLNAQDTHRVRNYYPTTEDDPILVFKRIYGDDAYNQAGKFPGVFEKGESFSHYEQIFRENMGDEFLKVKNKENIGDGTLVLDESVEYKEPLPDDDDIPFNQGGRVGMWKGSAKKGVGSLIKLVDDKLGKGTLKKAADIERPAAAVEDEATRQLFQDFNMKLDTQDLMTAAEPKMAGPIKTQNKGFWDPESTDHTSWLMQEEFFRPDAVDYLGDKVPSNWIALERKKAKDTLKKLGPLPSRRHPNWNDMRKIRQGVKNRLTALDITEELGGNVAMFDFLRIKRGSPEKFLNVEDYIRKADAPIVKDELSGIKKAFIQKKTKPQIDWEDPVKIRAAVDDIFSTGDYKMDAQMAAESLVENNPKAFGGKLFDDLDDATRSDIYGAVLRVVQSDLGKMLQMKRLSKPTKTLEGIKETGTIDISDPNIAEEFTKFMKETDPQGYAKIQKVVDDTNQQSELKRFKTKGRKPNAAGGGVGSMFREV